MIVGPLKSNIQLTAIILLVVSLFLWGSTLAFWSPATVGVNYNEHVLYHFFFENGMSVLLEQILSIVIILLGAFFVNYLAIDQEIVSKSNYLPFFFYVLFAFSSTTKNIIEPILVANLFVVPALFFLMNSYRVERALNQVFKAAFCMSIACFFCIDYMLVFPLMFVALFVLRPFNWREVIVLIVGLMVPIYLYMCLCYLSNEPVFNLFYMIKYATIQLQKPVVSEFYVVFLLITVLLFAFTLFIYINKGFGAKVKTQKAKNILLWMVFLCVSMMFFEQLPDMILVSAIIPLSIIIGDYIAEIKQLKIANTLLVLFVGGFMIVYFHALGII